MAVRGTVDAGAGGALVTSVTGTANQVTVTPTTGAAVVSLPIAITVPGSIAMVGAFSPDPAAGIVGTTGANNANAGSVGEYIASVITNASPVSFTSSGTPQNLTSISLTAGDWDVEGLLSTNPSVATTGQAAGISVTTNTMPASELQVNGIASASRFSMTVPCNRVSVAGVTTVYLVGNIFFASGTCTIYGFINARRVR